MRKLFGVLALSTALVAPVAVAAPAHAAVPCRVELYSIYANNVDETDGRDELRFLVGGNLYPRVNSNHVKMVTGDIAYGASFENPSSVITSTGGSVSFSLREVTLPSPGSGTALGSAVATGSNCSGLNVGQSLILPTQFISGSNSTWYSYEVKLEVTAI
ncbi:hypothetical protein [Herbidospora yilanensis]|uniref:hypothetical protein n=1 Tax=Herbidospora yilanensis TaxID=354426 RepID=UPI0007832B7F|nr:hypothetical protein [Herbidospora yilanensis]